VSPLLCQALVVVSKLLNLYVIVMIVYALLSWVPSLRGRWSDYVTMIVEPVLMPVRRIIPPLGGFDISFLIVIVFIRYLSGAIVPTSCYFY
jgi:YggT family protein